MSTQRTPDNAHIAFEFIRERILEQTYVPGQRLTGQDLARALGLSRTPIREALGQLEQLGLVQKSGWGYVVRAMTLKDIEDLFEVREVLEIAATRNAIRHVDDAWVASLKAIIKQSEKELNDNKLIDSIRTARTLYVSIVERADNVVLSRMLASINDQIQLVGANLILTYPWRAAEVLDENKQLVNAYANRKEEDAVRILTQHIRRSRDIHLSNTDRIHYR